MTEQKQHTMKNMAQLVNFNFSYHIHYSKKYKLYDIVIKKDGEFYKHYHLPTKKEVIKLIKF